VIQHRLDPHSESAPRFSPRLWPVRRGRGSIARWPRSPQARTRRTIGEITRVLRGTGAETVLNPVHPDTDQTILGTPIPQWPALSALVAEAARVLPGIRTQSWDVALTDRGPVLLEVNFGGDLNLSQLAYGTGVPDEAFAAHLHACGYRL
jgi:Sugar-transfer associated ATP-grasp